MANLYYYYLFKTSAPDGTAFFGIHRSISPSWGADGLPMEYIGNGPKLAAKARQFGMARLRTEVLHAAGTYEEVEHRLNQILTPATLADPRCLNMPREEINQNISKAMIDVPKSAEHKEAIAEAMEDNKNALGHVKSEETREKIGEARKGLKWYHNKSTGEEITLEEDEEALTGFELGRLPKEFKKNFKKDRKVHMSDADRARLIKD